MPVPISSTNPVEGFYPADEPRFAGSAAELAQSLVVLDVPDDSAAGGYASASITVGELVAAGGVFLTGTYTAHTSGAQTINVPDAVVFAAVGVAGAGGSLNPLAYGTGYTQAGSVLTILAAANVQAGEVIHFSYLAGSAAAGYTDAQARAAQLGRTAPSGTRTVTLTAESATDYGTAVNGTFTVDASGAEVGKVVRFALGSAATAPAFTNAPAGQPYKLLGATWLSGHAYTYSVLVCVDAIEVVCLLND